MKIVITGHTSGIGLALYNKFKELGHDVKGFSRSTGHDISVDTIREEILKEPFDIFVNNAYHESGQNRLLESLLSTTDQFIINISSNIVTMPNYRFTGELLEYKLIKQEANNIIKSYDGPAKILNVLPDIVKTNFYLGGELLAIGMDPNYVVESIIKEMDRVNKTKHLTVKHPDWSPWS